MRVQMNRRQDPPPPGSIAYDASDGRPPLNLTPSNMEQDHNPPSTLS